MTPSKYIKAQGLPSLSYVADKVNLTRPTLYNWYNNNFALFEVVVAGVLWLKMTEPVVFSKKAWISQMKKNHVYQVFDEANAIKQGKDHD